MSTPSTQVDRRVLLQNALATIEKMQGRLEAIEQAKREPIAIIGMSCRFPGGANNPEAYWRLLHEGVDAVTEVPTERWKLSDPNNSALEASDQATPWYGGFLEQIDEFDPQFFGLAPREATTMDPQQRLVLEVSWEALERAGIAPDKLRGSQTGIFVGITINDYAQLALLGDPDQLDAYTATGGALNVAPGRVAYTLGLQGPSMAIDTACSSSLVALHLACQSLRSGESNLALAGGVNVLLRPEAFVCFIRWGMMAPDGHCKTFDARADGFVRSEGCGMVVLKRLSDALAAGDNILALIRGSGVNQDGRSSGLTVPNGLAQQAVVRTALANARVKPAEISYVEAHGTGTSLGDPIEVEALGAVLAEGRSQEQPLFLGSVKTNIGHLESAAGIAGLMKVVLALQHREIPPHLHFQERSPRIPWPDFPIVIPTEPTPWNPGIGSRLAGVSAFGFSGTNAHIVLEEAPSLPLTSPQFERPVHLLALSAKSEPALKELAAKFRDHIRTQQPADSLADICYTANTGRAHFQHRLAVLAGSNDQMEEKLAAFAAGQEAAGLFTGLAEDTNPLKVVFLFTGQGSQYIGMGRQLYETQPLFRKIMDRCDELLRPYLTPSLLEVLYPGEEETNFASLLDQTAYTQPALFALEYALAELWQSWGIKPAAVMGHSVGEYVAACVAGVFSLEDGLKLIAERGRLMQALPSGGEMAAVFTDPERVEAAIESYADQVSIAAVNGPENVVISGAAGAVKSILETLSAEGIKAQRLSVSHAFHSPLMKPMLETFSQVTTTIAYSASKIDLISNVTGQLAGPEIAQAAYWRQHVRLPVLFARAIQTLYDQGHQTFLEIGPTPTLLSMGQRCWPASDQNGLWLPSLRPKRDDWSQMLQSLAKLYGRGHDIDWLTFDQDYAAGRRHLSLPTYPFQRDRYWLKPTERRMRVSKTGGHSQGAHPLLGSRVDLAYTAGVHIWQGELNLNRLPYLDDHRVQGAAVLPATAYIEMAIAAARELVGPGPVLLTKIENHKMLILSDSVSAAIQVIVSNNTNNEFNFQVYSQSTNLDSSGQSRNSWVLHASGILVYHPDGLTSGILGQFDPEKIQARCSEEISGQLFYQQLNQKGNEWGPSFQGVGRLWRGEGEALSLVRVPETLEKDIGSYNIHPAIADACGHVLAATVSLEKSGKNKGGAFVGGGLDEVRLYHPLRSQQLWSYARLRPQEEQTKNVLVGDVQVFDETGTLITETLGARLWYLEHDQSHVIPTNIEDWFYELEWQPVPQPMAEISEPSLPKTWLIFADREGVGAALASHLKASGDRCLMVFASTKYEQLDQDTFSIHPGQVVDIRQLLDTVSKAGWNISGGIVHLWSLDADVSENEVGPASLEAAQNLACTSTLHLVQELVRGQYRNAPHLWLVTRGAQAVNGDTLPPAVAQAPLWGFGRTLALEHSELWGGLIDLDPQASITEAATFLAEGIVHFDGEDQLACRREQWYVARLVRQRVNSTPTIPFHCQSDGSYLITGGLGGIGLEIARWLVQKGARRLILLGRTQFSPRTEWNKVENGSRLGHKIAAVRELEALGASIHLASVDVSDEKQLSAFLEQFQAEGWPPIRGVAHAAGIMMYQPLVDHKAETMQTVLDPKVKGGWLLHKLLKDAPLDFFVLFSSNSALLSSPLMSSYAAANTFLDSLAYYRKALGLAALSINWGTWAGVGMAVEFDGSDRPIELRGVGTIAPRQGLAALEQLLQQEEATQVAVMPINWQQWRESYPIFQKVPFLSSLMHESSDQSQAEKESFRLSVETVLASDPETRHGLIESYLSQHVARILGFSADALNIRQSITTMGLDSLMAVELKNRIETDLRVTIPMVQFLQGPSVTQLGDLVESKLAEADTAFPLGTTVSAEGMKDLSEATPEQLLANIDQLSEEQVDSLLNELLSEEKDVHS